MDTTNDLPDTVPTTTTLSGQTNTVKDFYLYYTLRGPGGAVKAPNKTNPVQAENIVAALEGLAATLKKAQLGFGLEVTEVHILEKPI